MRSNSASTFVIAVRMRVAGASSATWISTRVPKTKDSLTTGFGSPQPVSSNANQAAANQTRRVPWRSTLLGSERVGGFQLQRGGQQCQTRNHAIGIKAIGW